MSNDLNSLGAGNTNKQESQYRIMLPITKANLMYRKIIPVIVEFNGFLDYSRTTTTKRKLYNGYDRVGL